MSCQERMTGAGFPEEDGHFELICRTMVVSCRAIQPFGLWYLQR